MIGEEAGHPLVSSREQSPQSDLKTLESQLQQLVVRARQLSPIEAQNFLQKSNVKDLADQIRQLRQEKKEQESQVNEYHLPSVDIYPLKAKKEINQRLEQAEKAVSHLDDTMQKANIIIRDFINERQQKTAELNQTIADIKSRNHDAELSKLDHILSQIVLIEKHIARGSDIVPLVEKLINDLNSKNLNTQIYLPDKRDRKRFSQSMTLRERIKAFFLRQNDSYKNEKQHYQEQAIAGFRLLLSELPMILVPSSADAYVKFDDRYRLQDSNFEKKLEIYKTNWQSYLEKCAQLAQKSHLLTDIAKWCIDHQDSLAGINFWDDNLLQVLTNEIVRARQNIDYDQKQLDRHKHDWDQVIKLIIDDLLVSAENDVNLFSRQFMSFNFVNGLPEAHGSFIPLETISLRNRVLQIYAQLTVLVALTESELNEYFSDKLLRIKTEIESLSDRIATASKFNEDQPHSQDILWHTGKTEVLYRIISSGHLASRKSQLELFGKAVFSTAGIIGMTRNEVTIMQNGTPVKIPWDKYAEQKRRMKLPKDLDQEAFQVAFSKNEYHHSFFHNIAILVSEASLRSKSQFMESDGFHFFHENYRTNDDHTPGFDINLDSEPFVIAVTVEQVDELKRRLQTILTDIKQMPQSEIQAWLVDHIVVIHPHSSIPDINKEAYLLMQKQGLQIEKGYLVPTGEKGENAVRQLVPLFAYKSLTELENNAEAEQTTFDTAAVKAEIEKDEMLPRALIDLLRKDAELDELYTADAGLFGRYERYSIGQHTEMVLTQFERYFGYTMEKGQRAFMRLVLALHDIGKSKSVQETGSVKKQHEYTIPILSRVMEQMGYPPEAINLSKILVDQDYIGELLKGELRYSDPGFNNTRAEIQDRAQKNNITPAEYLHLIKILYFADAGSYTRDTTELGGQASLDYLFEFNREKRTVKFSKNQIPMLANQTPDQYFQEFENTVLQN